MLQQWQHGRSVACLSLSTATANLTAGWPIEVFLHHGRNSPRCLVPAFGGRGCTRFLARSCGGARIGADSCRTGAALDGAVTGQRGWDIAVAVRGALQAVDRLSSHALPRPLAGPTRGPASGRQPPIHRSHRRGCGLRVGACLQSGLQTTCWRTTGRMASTTPGLRPTSALPGLCSAQVGLARPVRFWALSLIHAVCVRNTAMW